jgi:hypothetical protein
MFLQLGLSPPTPHDSIAGRYSQARSRRQNSLEWALHHQM